VESQVVLRQVGFIIIPGGAPIGLPGGNSGAGRHSGGGLGDTDIAALARIVDWRGQTVQAGIGVSAPTGDPGHKLNPSGDYDPYALQSGSGTWDFLPSLTYTGKAQWLNWGAQVYGVKRLESVNSAGYRLGDKLETTAWAGVTPARWLSFTARGLFVDEAKIHGPTDGAAPHTISSPLDVPANYGGRTWELGLGATAVIPRGPLMGDFVSLEWLQPLASQLRGYQMGPTGGLNLKVGVAF
jgi:hypothetical protein